MQSNQEKKTLLIKIGGSILHHEQQMISVCADIKILSEAGFNVILVHGGSKAIQEALTLHGIPSEFSEGLRITTAQTMKIIKQVLCEQVNQTLVQHLKSIGIHAVGLSGADEQLLLCDQYSKQHGLVGNVKAVNTTIIEHLLHRHEAFLKTIPVIATIGVDHDGNAFNINADIAACHLANALNVHQLIYLTDQDGIYDEQGMPYAQLSADDLQTLIDQSIVSGGMLVKAKAILTALTVLNNIQVLNGNQPHILLEAVLYGKNPGTLCKNNELMPPVMSNLFQPSYPE